MKALRVLIVVVYIQRYRLGHEVDFVPPVTGIHLAALTPARHHVRVVHQQVEQVDLESDVDFVAISFFSGFAREAFRKEVGCEPEQLGNLDSNNPIKVAGSKLTRRTYNDVFEGDSLHVAEDNNRGYTYVNVRPTTTTSIDDGGAAKVTAKESLLGTPLGAKRSHVHFALNDGENSAYYTGNSQRNIALIESGSGHKDVNLKLGGGDNKAVMYLNDNASGTIFVDGGSGDNLIQIHAKTPSISYELADSADKNFTPDPSKLTILSRDVQSIEQYIAGERIWETGRKS